METKIANVVVYDCECEHGEAEEKKKGQNNNNNTSSPVTVVLKVDLHCDGCISRLVRLARRLEGVETVRADPASNKLTLIGFMDPVRVTEKLQKKSKKKIELLSPKPKKETKANNDTKADNNTTKTTVVVTTVILKLNCSCDGCIKRIHRTVSKTKGVYQVKMEKENEVVTVMGTMDVKTVTDKLKKKLKKTVQVLPEKKDKKKETKAEGITKLGSPGQVPCYCFNHGLGPYGFVEGPITDFFSEENQSSCYVM